MKSKVPILFSGLQLLILMSNVLDLSSRSYFILVLMSLGISTTIFENLTFKDSKMFQDYSIFHLS